MSGFQALTIGITGLQAQSSKIGAIADNLANVSTVGYKKTGVLFQNLLGSDNPLAYTPGGAAGFSRSLNQGQGIITGTTSSTDIAIAGKGFFAVRQTAVASGDLFYTRAGAFTPDANGDFVNVAGFFLQGWLLDDQEIPSGLDEDIVASSTGVAALQTVNVSDFTDTPVPTTSVSLIGNLTASRANYAGTPAYDATNALANMASGGVSPTLTKPITIVDTSGAEHTLTVGFLKTGANTWAIEVYASEPSELVSTNPQLASGVVTFNGDGTLGSVSGSIASAISTSWDEPEAATNSFTVNWGTAGALGTGLGDGLSQLDAPFRMSSEQNGFPTGGLSNISITEEGYVVGNYANGNSRRLFVIPLAVFPEQNELQNFTGNVFGETLLSGDVSFTQPGPGGFAVLFDSSLENSNVDTAEEMTEMIVAQRSYQFNTRIIDTTDKMLQTANEMSS